MMTDERLAEIEAYMKLMATSMGMELVNEVKRLRSENRDLKSRLWHKGRL